MIINLKDPRDPLRYLKFFSNFVQFSAVTVICGGSYNGNSSITGSIVYYLPFLQPKPKRCTSNKYLSNNEYNEEDLILG